MRQLFQQPQTMLERRQRGDFRLDTPRSLAIRGSCKNVAQG
jgi:hypothetical protein